MLKHTLLSAEGILILEPSEALEAADFEAVIQDMNPYLGEHDSLAGVIIFAKAFPGWLNLEAAIDHLQLIANYHQKIKRLAIVSDNGLLSALPTFAAHLVHPEVKHFSEAEYEDALNWVQEAKNVRAKKSQRKCLYEKVVVPTERHYFAHQFSCPYFRSFYL